MTRPTASPIATAGPIAAVRPIAARPIAARPGPAQVAVGAVIATVAAVVLLAVSGETAVWRVAVLVGFAVALGTLSAVLLTARPRVPAAPAAPAAPGASAPKQSARPYEYAHRSQ
ncbi:hypothetical protein ACIQF6_27195 [Kitasatospora sp. NPDC092948]|uniref:hypothetical protein n=1 Tax=Kitasatospora sp. NPDC092948 TaxID=3364088 RepID=UPI0038157ED7